MAEESFERVDPLIARWKKFTTADDGDRLAAVEHSPTSELQRLIKEVDEIRTAIDTAVSALETRYGVLETGEIGSDATPEPADAKRHMALRSISAAYLEAADEIADRESGGEV